MIGIRIPLVHEVVTLVDPADAEMVRAAGPWHFAMCSGQVYAQRVVQRDGEWEVERLHTFLTGWPFVDHKDGNGLNNRRSNLRQATEAQNAQNRRRKRLSQSGFRGVYLHKPTGLWQGRIQADRKLRSLGYFRDPADAARAYDAAAIELHGEFAQLNFTGEPA